jgi:glucose-1-phosphate cytidylyltransferase
VKVVILAGGYGTRMSEETAVRPKPMVEIGDRPILWHIMKIYSAFGLNDFIICCGHKGHLIKEYFSRYELSRGDVTFDFRNHRVVHHTNDVEPWTVTLVDTGEATMTGGRIKRVAPYLGNETFCLTYGDGVSDINIPKVIDFHRQHGVLATLTAVQPPGRFGIFTFEEDQTHIHHFHEKARGDGAWINGGFFVLEPEVLDYIEGDHSIWEKEPLSNLARARQLVAYRHDGYWQNMDALRDKIILEGVWNGGSPPWKVW